MGGQAGRSPVLRLTLIAAALMVVAASPSQAATAFQATSGGGVFVGGDETINHLFVTTPNATTIRVRSDVGTLTTSGTDSCTAPAANVVECPVTALVVEVSALGEADIVDIDGPISSVVYGGEGTDVLRGGSVSDQLLGEGGGDQLSGRDGNDDLRGDDGDDRLDGGSGSDLAIGGLGADIFEDTGAEGTDSVTYKVDSVGTGVRLTVGDGANDGRDDGAEHDDVRAGFERLQGSNHADVIRGADAVETINGSDGADDIDGGGGADTLEGNGGNDTLRAQDGIADAVIDCDAASDPPASNGTADVALVDSGDPEPLRCETVNRAGTGASTGGPGAPQNTVSPEITGVGLVGQTNGCTPGTWTEAPAFEYTWFVIDATGTHRRAGEGSSYTTGVLDGGQRLVCIVVAKANGQSTAASSPPLAVPLRVALTAPGEVKRSFPDYLAPTTACGAKGYCEADEVRQSLDGLKVPMSFRARAVEGLRGVPAPLRRTIRPGQVFATSPKPRARIKASLADPLRVKVSYYVPDPSRDCPIGETVEVRNGRDYSFDELLVGLSLRDAVRRLKAERCTQADYEVDYRYSKRGGDPVVSRSRTVDDLGKDQVRLTVDHGAPAIAINFVAGSVGEGRLPLRLGENSSKFTLVQSKKQTTDFDVHVGMRAGLMGFKRQRVELRDETEDLVALAFTDASGVARFRQAKIAKDGAYELWTSQTDAEGDAIVGWMPIDASSAREPFTGYDGQSYRYAKGRFEKVAASRAGGGDGVTVATMRAQALRIRAGSLAFKNSAAGQAAINRLTDAELGEVGHAYNLLTFFGEGTITLEALIGFGVRPTVATLGGTHKLGIGPGTSVAAEAYAVDEAGAITRQVAAAIRVGQGALGFVTESGATLFADGSFFLQSAGGNGFRDGVALGPAVVDVARSQLVIDNLRNTVFVGLIGQDGAGIITDKGAGVLSDNGLGIVANDGATIISGGGGNIVAGGAGNFISNNGGTIVSAGAGNLIGQDGAG